MIAVGVEGAKSRRGCGLRGGGGRGEKGAAGEGAGGRRGKVRRGEKAGERGTGAEGWWSGWLEVGSGVAVGLAGSWRCSRWCPGRRGASIARPRQGPNTVFRPCCRTCCHGGWMQRVKVAVDSFAFGASVTSLEGVGKP